MCFVPLIKRGNSGRPSAMPNYFGFYGIEKCPANHFCFADEGRGVVNALVSILEGGRDGRTIKITE